MRKTGIKKKSNLQYLNLTMPIKDLLAVQKTLKNLPIPRIVSIQKLLKKIYSSE